MLRLYRKISSKTPLEDFTTEVFVGILNIEKEIKNDFIYKFLQLKEDHYSLKTQVKYSLDNDQDCIVDFVLEGRYSICFIENKVNSKEGWRQLERYSKVLDSFGEDKSTHLIYCTKFHEKKKIDLHNFKQIRWFQIAKFLKEYKNNKTVNNFLTFLKNHRMSQELTLTTNDFITFENIQRTINLVNGYLDRVRPIFREKFRKNNKVSDGRSTGQVIQYNRMIFFYKDFIKGSSYSEIKYGFLFDEPRIFADVFLHNKHNQFENVQEEAKNHPLLHIVVSDHGVAIGMSKGISSYLNDESADDKINEWFIGAFTALEKFKSDFDKKFLNPEI